MATRPTKLTALHTDYHPAMFAGDTTAVHTGDNPAMFAGDTTAVHTGDNPAINAEYNPMIHTWKDLVEFTVRIGPQRRASPSFYK